MPFRPETPDYVHRHYEHRSRALWCSRKSLRRHFKAAEGEERTALSELTNILRKRLITLRRAEWHRRKGKERARKRSAFIGNTFIFIKKLLGQKRSGHLSCPVEEINHHLNITFSDAFRDQELGPCKGLVTPPEPATQCNYDEPTLTEVKQAFKAARYTSSVHNSSPKERFMGVILLKG